MRHARSDELDSIHVLIGELRNIDGIREKHAGHFYFKGKNVIHFHYDLGTIYADIGDSRIKITSPVDTDQVAGILHTVRLYMGEIIREVKKH